jgi:co-chaperonin GroES (HSP10)
VLVLPDKAAEQTTGGIYIPKNQKDTHDLAAESGIIVAIGDGAWSWNMDRTRRFEGNKPKVGDRVCFVRYAGTEVIGDDGEMYRVCSDASITGIRNAKPAKQEKAA